MGMRTMYALTCHSVAWHSWAAAPSICPEIVGIVVFV